MDSDFKLVRNVKDKACSESLSKLIDKHRPLCFTILAKFLPTLLRKGFSKEDVFQDANFIIFKSAFTFKTTKKTKFSTWIGNYTRYHCLNLINSNKCDSLVSTEDESIKNILNKTECILNNNSGDIEEYISFILEEMQDKRAKDIYLLRYFPKDGKRRTWKQIAKELNISSQTVINIHNKAKFILRSKIKSKNNYDSV